MTSFVVRAAALMYRALIAAAQMDGMPGLRGADGTLAASFRRVSGSR